MIGIERRNKWTIYGGQQSSVIGDEMKDCMDVICYMLFASGCIMFGHTSLSKVMEG